MSISNGVRQAFIFLPLNLYSTLLFGIASSLEADRSADTLARVGVLAMADYWWPKSRLGGLSTSP